MALSSWTGSFSLITNKWLGRLDVATAIITTGSFRVAPREGHLMRLRRIYGCMKHGMGGQLLFAVVPLLLGVVVFL